MYFGINYHRFKNQLESSVNNIIDMSQKLENLNHYLKNNQFSQVHVGRWNWEMFTRSMIIIKPLGWLNGWAKGILIRLTLLSNTLNILHPNFSYLIMAKRATISTKIIEKLYSNRVTLENKTIHTPPPTVPLHSKLGCWLFSTGSLNSRTTFTWRRLGRESFI